ncbi:hypothetical protein BDW74DRAFT_161859 [Aspergillus multicolor]|uniref:uncharacterized protein n=1 Tax=Aspergillus multicolor TaxID=41759 RepID=UPI003CCD63BF
MDKDPSYAFLLTIPEAITIIREFSEPFHEPPEHLHIELVRSIRNGAEMQQPEDRTWKHILKSSLFKDQKRQVLTLIEYMGATDWFDKQVTITQHSETTQKGDFIARKTAAGRVLNDLWKKHSTHSGNVIRDMQAKERRRIWSHLHRVRVLRNEIVEQLGIGVLFLPNISAFMDLSSKDLAIAIQVIQPKPDQTTLLRLLGEQVEHMAETGCTDLYTFCTGLKENALVHEQEVAGLLADMQADRVDETQVQDPATSPTGSQVAPSVTDHESTTHNQLPEVAEPSFMAYRDNDTSPVHGFEFENVPISSDDISRVKDNVSILRRTSTARPKSNAQAGKKIRWLSASHIRFFCIYLKVHLSRGCHAGKIHFFCPMSVEVFKTGWQSILEAEGPQTDEWLIRSARYLVFPLVTKENDHWFTVIISRQDELANVETPSAYILDSCWHQWKRQLQQPTKAIIAEAMPGATATGNRVVRLYEATEGTLPQQSKELCGYYLMLYLELLARDPIAMLTRIRKFNTAKTRMDHLFKPGDMDRELAMRFAELVGEFQYLELREGRLVTKSGGRVFNGDLTCLARGVDLVQRVTEDGENA